MPAQAGVVGLKPGTEVTGEADVGLIGMGFAPEEIDIGHDTPKNG
jgi:hypothetical protein